jgi:hypothetical protein
MTDSATKASARRFVLTICVGSFLLFLVQPMVARMALPRLGGAPAVWNSAMLVYQALLLGGYAYAHWLGRFGPRRQAAIHLALFAAAALTLPLGLISGTPSAQINPVLWVPWLLTASIGPLFFMVAAQAPLMQRWYVETGGADPYPLYAASNLGSFGGLIAYPLLVEPFMPVVEQRWLWSGGYLLLMALVLVCALRLPKAGQEIAVAADAGPPPARRTVALWILLAAIPSGLMLSTSLHITTDVVAMPLLWVLPLGLYLLSFSLAFSESRTWTVALTAVAPLLLLMAASTVFADPSRIPMIIGLVALLTLFVVSVALHGALYDARPHPAYLTRFYLAMSVGGVIGGIFCALLAPLIFDWTYEHPILLALAGLMIVREPLFAWAGRLWNSPRAGAWVTSILLLLCLLASLYGGGVLVSRPGMAVKAITFLFIAAIAIPAIGNRLLFTGCLAYMMLCMGGWEKIALSATAGATARSYFGVYSIRDSGNGSRLLVHGTTIHGIQNLTPGMERAPTSYYAPQSGIGLALTAVPSLYGPHARIASVGLGAGTLTCYSRPGQHWRIYEIDPVVLRIASNPRQFTFLSRCMPHPDVAIGDARLTLGREPSGSVDLLSLDAFSSDSVPMHLLTREAFALYGRVLAPNGLLLVHISNRYLELEPVIAAAARDGGWQARLRFFDPDRRDEGKHYASSSWIALSRDPATMTRLLAATKADRWRALSERPGFSPWTDDYGSIVHILKL